MQKAKIRRPMGRPPGTAEHEHLIHVRISSEIKDGLEAMRRGRGDKPTISALVREILWGAVKAGRK